MADDIIKSALDLAMEKVEKLGEATAEERLQWKYAPEGEKLAGKYLKNTGNLPNEIENYEENVRQYVVDGAVGVLARNIAIPRNDAVRKNNSRAMDGLMILKKDKAGLEAVFAKIEYLFNHYAEDGERQRNQAYQTLKEDMTARIQQTVQQQMGQVTSENIDVERHPQFQQEWRKMVTQLDSVYQGHLDTYKRELAGVT